MEEPWTIVELAELAAETLSAAPAARPAGPDAAGAPSGPEQADPEQSGADQAGLEKADPERAGTEQAGLEKADPERAGTEQSGAEPAGPEQAGAARANGRVRDVPNERLIRWYVTVGLVDPPLSRRGRVAQYGRRHLLQLVAVKRRQAEGRSLAEIQAELAGATDERLAAVARIPDTRPALDAPAAAPARFWARQLRQPGQPASAAEGIGQPGPAPVAAESPSQPGPAGPVAAESPSQTGPATTTRPGLPASVAAEQPRSPGPVAAEGRGQLGAAAAERPGRPARPAAGRPRVAAAVAATRFRGPGPPAAHGGQAEHGAGPPAGGLVHGVRLAPGVTLLLEGAGREPGPDDVTDIVNAAQSLLAELASRRLCASGPGQPPDDRGTSSEVGSSPRGAGHDH